MADTNQQEFARQTRAELLGRGLSESLTRRLIEVTGPERAIAALEWAQRICADWTEPPARDALRIVVAGLPRDFGVGRHLDAFAWLELLPPPPIRGRTLRNGDLSALVAGVKVVLEWCIQQQEGK